MEGVETKFQTQPWSRIVPIDSVKRAEYDGAILSYNYLANFAKKQEKDKAENCSNRLSKSS